MYATETNLLKQSTRPFDVVSAKTHSICVRELLRDDYPYVTTLEAAYGLECRSFEEWNHLWDSNPAYLDVNERWPRGWVLVNKNQVVGYLGNIPLWYEFEGKRLLVAASHAWVVDTNFRKYSILLLDRCFKQKDVDLYVCSSANRQSSSILSIFNSARAPVGSWDESLFWITNYRGFARSWVAMKSPRFAKWLDRALPNAVPSHCPPPRASGHRVKYQGSFDDSFDAFWQQLRKEQFGTLLAVRSREALQWHFHYALLRNRAWILTISDDSNLAAYTIFCRQDSVEYGLRRMRLIDFQALRGREALLLPMFESALARCRKEGIYMLECIGLKPEVQKLLTNLHPRTRRLPSWLYYYTPATPELATQLARSEVWNPSCFDGDMSL